MDGIYSRTLHGYLRLRGDEVADGGVGKVGGVRTGKRRVEEAEEGACE